MKSKGPREPFRVAGVVRGPSFLITLLTTHDYTKVQSQASVQLYTTLAQETQAQEYLSQNTYTCIKDSSNRNIYLFQSPSGLRLGLKSGNLTPTVHSTKCASYTTPTLSLPYLSLRKSGPNLYTGTGLSGLKN